MILEGSSVEDIELGLDSPIPGNYYNIKNQKGTVTCINLSNENKNVTNTKELKEGSNDIKCSMIYEKEEVASLTRTFKVDGTIPNIISEYTSTAYTTIEKADIEANVLYIVTYGAMGGSTTCKNENAIITNLSVLSVGTHTLTCTATGNNGKTASINIKVRIKSSAEELADKNNLPFLAGGYRYQGNNANNWICFGDSSITNPSTCDSNHLWRIIGVFDGQMKIMTNYYYSEEKAWNTNGSNNWEASTLKAELNGNDFYNNHTYIDEAHRKYIMNATWYFGENNTKHEYTLQEFVNGEKNKSTMGYIGLMNVVDYGYAGSQCTLSTNINGSRNVCMTNNWIGYEKNQWTITPPNGYTYNVWMVHNGFVGISAQSESLTFGVRPTLYLDSGVKILSGNGTKSFPYIVSK